MDSNPSWTCCCRQWFFVFNHLAKEKHLSNSSKTQGKHTNVRVLSSPLKIPGFPRVFRISGQVLWSPLAPMQLGAWHLRRCISRGAPRFESFVESRWVAKTLWGLHLPSLAPIHPRGGGRIRTKHVINPPASVASGLRALTCLSLLRFRKRKKPNYFDNYSGFADF